ncbi:MULTISPECIES: TM2 domain-containing protein [Nocardia]|uniref:TM2 domain-containing protein n=1 Tax=Nocardia TaxID=1817 RepID=UPI0018951686|nr:MULTISPECIES: TM2 domain-containing protein [Nocardia]MBF6351688.1 NINE protein [Nocardia flavorosea]
MTDPYQQGGPQYGPPGTGPDLSKAPGYPSQPQAQPYPSQPYGAQPYPGQPDPQYGAAPGYGQQDPVYGQPGAYGQPGPGYGAPMGYNPMDPEAPYGRDMYGVPLSDKQKMVAGLLQIFFGYLGIGRFYLGDTGVGIGQIAASIFTCGIAGSIWGLIDGIMILTGKVTDTHGRPLRD